jgi:hypothetical protein
MNRSKSAIFTITALSAFLFFMCFTVGQAEASITIAWDPTTLNVDGTVCGDLSGYKIYYDTDQSGAPYNGTGLAQGNSPITVPLSSLSNPWNPALMLSGLTAGATYFIVVAAYDTSGTESGFSNEIRLIDSDSDGLVDVQETLYGFNPMSTDSDGDGISDGVEFGPYGVPLDSEADGTYDGLDMDSDNDGKSDSQEGIADDDADGAPNYCDINDADGPFSDQDADGLTNADETSNGLNPNLADSDGDKISDVEEWGGSNFPADTDGDGILDAVDTDSDNDGASDLDEDGVDSDLDGILDRLDDRTATMLTLQGKMSLVLGHTSASLSRTTFVANVVTGGSQPQVDFPYGGVEYHITGLSVGETVLVTIIMPDVLPAGAEYWKYDPQQGFQKLPSQVNGKEISFDLQDGGLGDSDGISNRVIVDPGYIGIPSSGGGGGGGGSGGCSLSKGSGSLPSMFFLFLPLLLIRVLRRMRIAGN